MEKLVICERCGGNACLEQEINPNYKTWWDYGCGFVTNSYMTEDSEFYKEQMSKLPELYKDLSFKDKEGKVWLPSIINVPKKGMIYAYGNNKDNWKWATVLAVKVTEEEKTKYPIPGKKGEYYEWRMDPSKTKYFEEKDYLEALDYIDVINPE